MSQREPDSRLRLEILLALTRAAYGSRRLDQLLAYAIGQSTIDRHQVERLLFDGGPIADPDAPWSLIACPAYTSMADVTLPGERIEAVHRLAQRNRWQAEQQEPGGRRLRVVAGNEILARRAAALSCLLRAGEAQVNGNTGTPERAPAQSAAGADGKVAGGMEIPARLGLENAAQGRPAGTPARPKPASQPSEGATPARPAADPNADDDEWQIMF